MSDFLELELQAAMSHVMWVPGVELWSLKEQDVLTTHLTSPAPQTPSCVLRRAGLLTNK